MNNQESIILVTGATGQQGGATVRHLLAKAWPVRALTRDPHKPAAQALAAHGVEVVGGDLEDRASLDKALAGVYGVFSIQQFYGIGPEGETRQGKALADAAKAAGVQHFVYTSVGSAERHTRIPHFESKFAIEQHIRAIGLPHTILRPVGFMENYKTFSGPQLVDGVLTLSVALRPDKTSQMIAVDDIGALAALAFEKPQEFMGQALEIAGDELTMPQVAEAFSRVTGQPHRFVELPLEQVRHFDPELALMFEWFNEVGYHVNIPALRAIHPQLMTFETWLRQTN